MITQELTFYKDDKIKTYTEKVDGLICVFIAYNKKGDVVYLRYSKDNWERWTYDERNYLIKHTSNKGVLLERRFDDTGRMTYEKTLDEGVTYDRSLNYTKIF